MSETKDPDKPRNAGKGEPDGLPEIDLNLEAYLAEDADQRDQRLEEAMSEEQMATADATRDATGYERRREWLSDLPAEHRASAYVGFNQKNQTITELPKGGRILAIQYPASLHEAVYNALYEAESDDTPSSTLASDPEIAEFMEALEGSDQMSGINLTDIESPSKDTSKVILTAPLQKSKFMGSSNDDPNRTLTSFHYTPSKINIPEIARRLAEVDSRITITSNSHEAPHQKDSTILLKTGGVINVVNQRLLSDGILFPDDSEDDLPPTSTGGKTDQVKLWGNLSKLTPAAHEQSQRDLKAASRRGALPTDKARCNYLVINPKALASGLSLDAGLRTIQVASVKKLGNEIAMLANATGIWLEQINGKIVIISTVERPGSDVRKRMKAISKSLDSRVSQFYGSGTINRSPDGKTFNIDGFPSEAQLKLAEEHGAGRHENIYIPLSQLNKINTNRDSTHYSLEAEAIPGTDIAVVKKVESKIKLQVGGPDKRIGLQKQADQLQESTAPQAKSRLTVLKGHAGTGKSRLLSELTESRNTLVISLDPARKSVPGYQLVLAVDQIAERMGSVVAEIAAKRASDTPISQDELNAEKYAKEIIDLAALTDEQKSAMAVDESSAHEMVNKCTRALKAYETVKGPFVFVFDDVHHVDSVSEKPLMSLVRNFINTCSSSRAVLALRPEEMYKSVEQRKLEAWVRGRSEDELTTIEVEPLPFKENLEANRETPKESLAYQYIFHSLPKKIRHNNTTGEDRELGEWWLELAGISTTPLELTTYIYEITKDPNNLILEDKTIHLKPGVIEHVIELSRSGDINTIHKTRIDELAKENKKAKLFLSAIAMLGRDIDSATTHKLAGKLLGGAPEDYAETLKDLQNSGFLLGKGGQAPSEALGGEPDIAYRHLQHDTLRDAILESLSAAEKRKIGNTLLELFPYDLTDDLKFSLLHYSAADSNLTARSFWESYGESFNSCLQEAVRLGQTARIRELSLTFLQGLDGIEVENREKPEKPHSKVGKLVAALKKHPTVRAPGLIVRLAIDALRHAAKSTQLQGRFSETYALVDTLLEIKRAGGYTPFLDEEKVADICETGFQAAYDERNATKRKQYAGALNAELFTNQEIVDPHSARALLVEYKSEYKAAGADLGKLSTLRDKFDSAEYLTVSRKLTTGEEKDKNLLRQFSRLQLRVEFELINQTAIRNRGIDDDASTQPNHLTVDETTKLFDLRKRAKEMLDEERTHPGTLEKIELLYLLDQQAEIEALLGNYEGRTTHLTAGRAVVADMEHLDGFLEGQLPDTTLTLKVLDAVEGREDGSVEMGAAAWRVAAAELDMNAVAMRLATNQANDTLMAAITKTVSHAAAHEEGEQGFRVTALGQIELSHSFDIQKIKEAIDIFTNQAIKLGENVTDREFYQMVARVNRLRAISLLSISLQTKLDDAEASESSDKTMKLMRLHAEFGPYYNLAIQDLSYLNTNPIWGQFDESGEMAYFIASSTGHIMDFGSRCIQGFDRTTELELLVANQKETKLPHLHPDALEAVINDWIVDKRDADDLYEVDRKIEGIEKYIEGIINACEEKRSEITDPIRAIHVRYSLLYEQLLRKKGQREYVNRGSVVTSHRQL
jgi:hypothetical protein